MLMKKIQFERMFNTFNKKQWKIRYILELQSSRVNTRKGWKKEDQLGGYFRSSGKRWGLEPWWWQSGWEEMLAGEDPRVWAPSLDLCPISYKKSSSVPYFLMQPPALNLSLQGSFSYNFHPLLLLPTPLILVRCSCKTNTADECYVTLLFLPYENYGRKILPDK